MAIFEYKAFSADGKNKKGLIEADSAKTARAKLKKQRLMVTSMSERSAAKRSGGQGLPFVGGRIGQGDISVMVRQLASLIRANIPLVEALTALRDQTDKEKLKVVLDKVRNDVNEGTALAKAMLAHPKVFDNISINMIEAGESSGTLGDVLIRLADLKEAQMRLRGKITSGMMYPALMMLVAVGMVIAIFTFVIPKLTQVFESIDKELPFTTLMLIWISEQLINNWPLVLAVAIGGGFLFLRYINSKSGKPKWHRFLLSAPVLGSLNRMIAVSRFANTMSTLLASGVPILTAMNIARNIVGNVHIAAAISEARENITEGQSIADPLKRSGEFPPMVIHMISIGEKTGELPDMLGNVSRTYEEQVNTKIEGLVSLLEPLMIIVMGGVVAFIVFSIFMPLLEISNVQV